MNQQPEQPKEPEVSPEIQAAFARVRIARQEKIDRYKSRKTYRQPYKDPNDTDGED